MNFALNEVEALAKRATRGAGYPWGLAEEAGKATRFLSARGFDGCGSLATLLDQGFGPELGSHMPECWAEDLKGKQVLCPLGTGSFISDNALRLDEQMISLKHVASPLLLMPFIAQSARLTRNTIVLVAGKMKAVTNGADIEISGTLPDLADFVTIETVEKKPVAPSPRFTRVEPGSETWEALMRFSHLTYAPATEESRNLGAGAGVHDND